MVWVALAVAAWPNPARRAKCALAAPDGGSGPRARGVWTRVVADRRCSVAPEAVSSAP